MITGEQIITWAGYVGMAAAAVVVCWQQYRSGRSTQTASVMAAKDETIKAATQDRDAWKSMLDAKEKELADYRAHTHSHADVINQKLLALTEENASLKARTDLAPVLKNQAQQNEINEKVLLGLDLILKDIRKLGRRQGSKKIKVKPPAAAPKK